MEKFLEVLDFEQIKNEILKYNINSLSRKKVEDLHPLYFYETIKEELDKTREGYNLASLGTMPSLSQVSDLSDYLSKVDKNGVLNLTEIYEFKNHLEKVMELIKFSQEKELENYNMPYFKKYVASLSFTREVYDNIKFCVTSNYTLYDHASLKLKSIRNSITKCEEDIKVKLNSYLKNNSDILSDNFIATRGSHLVLPVKAANKSQIKGIVIDVSSSRETLFIEPYSVTENNIKLESLRYEEEIEIQRIIRALCDIINKYNATLLLNNETLKEISFMYLKGIYGQKNDYEIATLVEDNSINLIKARHPLIDVLKVVSNDYTLGGKNNNIIVISGPNAGGKTVALKTIALLVIMNQCGLPIPCKEATLGVFRKIFVDIGDEQSILHSLSGFSSHIANVSEIINNVDSHSLVILDELGSRTDPKEGEALAKAIISYLENSKATAMITTHYLGIKDYAKEESNITLASMGFDEKTLMPSYKLLLNVVGRSYAFEISARLGLKKEIIDKAIAFKDSRSNDLDSLIDELSHKMQLQNELVKELDKKNKVMEEKLSQIALKESKLNEIKDKMLDEVKQTKDELIEEAMDQINSIVDEFKKSTGDTYKPHLKNQALDALDMMSSDEQKNEHIDETIHVGDDVMIKSLGKIGKVTDIKGNKAVVISSNNTLRISMSDLVKHKISSSDKKIKNKVKVSTTSALYKSIPLSLNLVGQHVDEALILLRQYIDAALLAHYSNVTIIHGHGTGALRKAVGEFLKKSPYVEEFRLGSYNEGGVGATIVTLKKGK